MPHKDKETHADADKSAADMVRDVAQTAAHTTSEIMKDLSEVVKKYPVESAVVGFGIGCLLGALFTRRR
jgi:ElaB/YqjD/DUF883 family membrane-anchored ribosome-binding protein